MDLNLYLGFSPYLRPRSLELGSDLALSCPLLPSSSEDWQATMSGLPSEPLDAHIPYSPTNPMYSPINGNDDPFRSQDSPQYTPSQEPNGGSDDHSQPISQEAEEFNDPFMPPYDFDLPSIPPWPPAAYNELFGLPLPATPNAEPPAPESPHSRANSTAFGTTGEFPAPGDGAPLLGQEVLQTPEVRFQRLIESNERSQLRQNRSPDSNDPEELMCGIMTSQRSLMASGKLKVIGLGKAKEASDDEDGKSGCALNFECNICLDMAKEPVVTSCGHLFCWPCLYQWLHIHCDHKECPVCKGEVMDSKIIPIYGRGGSETAGGRKLEVEIGEVTLEVPPRPHGQRVESLRQQLRNPEASERLRDGIATTWRRIIDGEISNTALHDTNDSRLLRLLNVAYRRTRESRSQRILHDGIRYRTLAGLSAQRTQMEGDNSEGVLNLGTLGNSPRPQRGAAAPFQNGTDLSRRFPSLYDADRLRAISADINRMVGRIDNSLMNHVGGASASPQNAQNSEPPVSMSPAADQASASSTMAVIEGDTAAQVASAEPNNIAGSSRVLRRRGRSSTSGSLDVDGGALPGRKRRRPN